MVYGKCGVCVRVCVNVWCVIVLCASHIIQCIQPMHVWSSSFFSVMRRRRNHLLRPPHQRVDQARYRRKSHGGDDQVLCNERVKDSPMVPPKQRPIPDDVSEHMYDAIVNPAACGEDNRSTEMEGPSESRYATPSGISAPQPMIRRK